MIPAWRFQPFYRELLAAGRSALAWEVLRRDPLYAAAATAAGSPAAAAPAVAQRWGVLVTEPPDQPFDRARIIWTAAVDPGVLSVVAHHHADPVFDLARQPHAVIVTADGREHVAIPIARGALRLDVIAGSLLDGPVALDVHLACTPAITFKLRAVDHLLRLAGVRGAARAAPPADRRLPRLVEALRVVDALAAGASQAEIAAGLSGSSRRPDNWPGDGEYLRSRIRRRVTLARRLLAGGPAAILGHRI